MIKFFALRAVRGVLVVTTLVIATFLLTRSFTDPARVAVGENATDEQYQQMREFLGMNKPAIEQLLSYLGGLFQGDFGVSTWQRTPALDLVLERVPATLTLAVAAILVGLVVGVPLGFAGAVARRRSTRFLTRTIPMVLVSLAQFWVGIMLVLILSVELGWLPTSGRGGIEHMIMPVATLAMVPIGNTAAMVTAAVQEEMSKRYVVAARAKGLTEMQTLWRHVLKNVAPTFVTVLGYEFVYVFTGSAVLVESVFQWPGVGKLAVDSVVHSDVILISAVVVITGSLAAFVNTFIDFGHYAIDRRVKVGG